MTRRIVMQEKLKESIRAVLPIALIVTILCLLLVPVENGLLLSFLIGTVFIIVGMALFTIGADVSMTQIGNHMGARLTKTRKLSLILGLSIILGIAITVAEPDLQVLAANTPGINTTVLIMSVSVGVGLFLAVSMLRIIFSIPLKWLLLAFYGLAFLLAFFSDANFLGVAFDSGGVTTGPMTVPFIMALGVGVASIRSDEKAKSDSFGLVALCSIGPILSVLLLGFLYPTKEAESAILVNQFESSVEIGFGYLRAFPDYMGEVAMALLPIFLSFLVFQIFSLKLSKKPFRKILIGLVYTYVGLVLFLTGVNVGFSSLGYILGGAMVERGLVWLLIPVAMLMGWFIIKAEPAVHVLNTQVAEVSAGAVTEKMMDKTLSIAIAAAMGLALIRVLTGISIMWFVLPGYAIALALSFVVSPTFTAIAFDAGGVASGPMTATFMLPFVMGVCTALGRNIMTDAFGLVALVALMPPITVQIMGVVTKIRSSASDLGQDLMDKYAEDETIELWEVE